MIDLNLKNEEIEIFEDPDPTHYLDLSLTKDSSHFIINSSTKEDSELYIMKREPGESPIKLIQRTEGVKIYADHVRDGWVFITNDDE